MEGLKEYILKEDAVAAVMETDPHIFLTYNKKKEKTDIVVAQITEEVLEEINKIPAADIEPRWIPVTERLPEKYGRYLVTLEDEGYRSVMPLYYGRIGRISTFYDSDSEYGDIEYCGIIAWMPLPSTYKEGGQKDD